MFIRKPSDALVLFRARFCWLPPLMLLPCILLTTRIAAQSPAAAQHQEQPSPIKDNSFLIEEAYNQESGVVQHVSTFSHSVRGAGWIYTFTQEWPLAGQTHQLSYTIPVGHNGDPVAGSAGLGDVAIHYRYQFGGVGDARFAFAPRVTLLLPTGNSRRALGDGGPGFQFNLPFSAVLSDRVVAHSNAGMTFTSRARDSFDNSAPTRSYAVGQSLIWLAHPKLNVMLESAWLSDEEVMGPRQTERSAQFVVSPGLRGAIDFASGLQIVPGLAFPFGVGRDREDPAVFVYLSFEHAFGKRTP